MDSNSSLDTKYLRFNGTNYLKQKVDLIPKNSEDCDLCKIIEAEKERNRNSFYNDSIIKNSIISFDKNSVNLSSDSDTDCKSDDDECQTCSLHNLEDQYFSSTSCSSICDDEKYLYSYESSLVSEEDDDDENESSSSDDLADKEWKQNYTMSKIIGNPVWSNKFKCKKFSSLEEFKIFKARTELILYEVLENYAYNTFGSFSQFYDDFKKNEENDKNISFKSFYSNYKAKLEHNSLSCVGLSLKLLEKFQKNFGDSILKYCGTVSCEEVIKDPLGYNMHLPNTIKEHVLVALKFMLSGKEIGYLLFDPGYHINEVIVVMRDNHYSISSENPYKKEFIYKLISDKFVSWTLKETKTVDNNKVVKEKINLIYVKQSFGSAIEIAEKRSFIYTLKSFVVRNKNGILAGFYSYLKNGTITIFYPENKDDFFYQEIKRKQNKYNLNEIGSKKMIEDLYIIADFVVEMNVNIGYPNYLKNNQNLDEKKNYAFESICSMLLKFKNIALDRQFIDEMLKIDLWIECEL